MTADLRQAIEILQYSALEIADFVAQEMADNPYLESEGESGQSDNRSNENSRDDGRDEGDWDNAWDSWATTDIDDSSASGPVGESYGGGSGDGFELVASRASAEQTLQGYVQEQFDHAVADPVLRMVGKFVIDALDETGYLRTPVPELAARLKVHEDVVDDARAIIQTLEPAGVGARDLKECLELQLHALGRLDDGARVVLAHLDKVASRQWPAIIKIAAQGGIELDEEEIKLVLVDIQACNPKPGLAFSTARVDVAVPDVVVSRAPDGSWRADLNGAAFPKLLIQGNTLKTQDKKAAAYMAERQGRAKWLVGALEQRAQNILKVAREVVAVQGQFFEAGPEFLVPLTLKQVAEKVGVHESTVSRVTSGKFMQTPMGVLEFKYFFSASLNTSGGTVAVAANSVQAMVARLVKAENPAKPLSDEQLVALLKNEGVDVARRTVAKYRGILGIPGTAERRVRG